MSWWKSISVQQNRFTGARSDLPAEYAERRKRANTSPSKDGAPLRYFVEVRLSRPNTLFARPQLSEAA